MRKKRNTSFATLLRHYDALMAKNFKLQAELEREKEINRNYWSSIVWLRSSDEFREKANPCPFCGSRHVGLEGSTCDAKWFVMCDCGAMGPEADGENEAIRAWNRAMANVPAERFKAEETSYDLKEDIRQLKELLCTMEYKDDLTEEEREEGDKWKARMSDFLDEVRAHFCQEED